MVMFTLMFGYAYVHQHNVFLPKVIAKDISHTLVSMYHPKRQYVIDRLAGDIRQSIKYANPLEFRVDDIMSIAKVMFLDPDTIWELYENSVDGIIVEAISFAKEGEKGNRIPEMLLFYSAEAENVAKFFGFAASNVDDIERLMVSVGFLADLCSKEDERYLEMYDKFTLAWNDNDTAALKHANVDVFQAYLQEKGAVAKAKKLAFTTCESAVTAPSQFVDFVKNGVGQSLPTSDLSFWLGGRHGTFKSKARILAMYQKMAADVAKRLKTVSLGK